ncbi:MAG: DUF3887 domain-containing protein [Planctomycetes bacterium]|nr:DUF3887 domain-containing protein [Planctomycetota bacterium]
MAEFLSQISLSCEWLWRYSLQVSMLAVMLLVVKGLLKKRLPARWHYFLWMLLLIRIFIPWAPQSSLSVFNFMPPWKQSISITGFGQDGSNLPIPVDFATETEQPVAVSTTAPIQAKATSFKAKMFSESLIPIKAKEILPFIWFGGVIIMGLYVLAGNFRLWRIVKRERLFTNHKVLELLEDCKEEMRVQTVLGVVVTDKIKSPALFGFIRPRLLLPTGMVEALSPASLRHVLLHELAHLKRHDIGVGWLAAFCQALHWFNPLVWYSLYRMRSDREMACDELVLSTGKRNQPSEYGATIINLLEKFSCPRRLPGLAGILEEKSLLKRRIAMIMLFRKDAPLRTALALFCLVVIGFTFLTNAQEATPGEKDAASSAKEFVQLLVKEEFVKAANNFDATMAKAMSPEQLAMAWKSTTGQAGEFQQELGSRQEQFLGSQIVYVTCEFEKGPLDVKVVYDQDLKISGLWFVPTSQQVLDGYRKAASGTTEETIPAADGEIIRLSYGDNQSDGIKSIGGNGPAIRFETPAANCQLTAIRIYGSRYGNTQPPQEDFKVWVCDGNFQVIKEFTFPYSSFTRGDPKWVMLSMEPTLVPITFVISAGFNAERTKGVYVHFDNSTSGNSFIWIPGQDRRPFNEGEWLIQAKLRAGATWAAQPSNRKISTKDKLASEELTQEGWSLWQQRKLVEAEELFQEAVQKDPGSDAAYQGLGWAQFDQGKKGSAMDSFEKCIAINPENSAALNGLGYLAKGMGNNDEAIDWWEKAVAVTPNATASLSGLTKVYMEQEKYPQAIKYYKLWLEVDPNNQDAKSGLETAENLLQGKEQGEKNQGGVKNVF